MKKIIVYVEWYGNNFGASVDAPVGAVVLTAKTYKELQESVPETLRFHIEGLLEDGDDVEEWLRNGDYEFEYQLNTAALIRACESYISLAAISRASGINQHQLSHYANGIKTPREAQRARIVKGIHKIAKELMSVY